MRRNLAIASVVALVIAGFGLGVLLFIGFVDPALWTVIFCITLLALIAGILFGVFGIILPIFGRSAGTRAMTDAAAAGRDGLARVLGASSTGAQLNGAYVYDVDLVVDQTGVPAYRTRDRIRIHRTDGVPADDSIISVVRLRDDAPEVAVIAGPARTPQDALVPQDAPPWV
jgi:hypothetical protein